MNRHVVVNIVLALIALSLVGWALYLENDDGTAAPATTTTTSTTTTTLPPTTLAPTTVAPTTVPETTLPSTTLAPTTLPPTTLPPTTLPPPDRALVPVVVTAAGLNGERVGPTAYLLSLAGWTDVRGVNGAVQLPATIIYYVDGFQNAAELMAVDMQQPLTSVQPIAAMPPVAGVGNAALVVYLGDA